MPSRVHPPHDAQKPRIWLRVRVEGRTGSGGFTSRAREAVMTVRNYIKERPDRKEKACAIGWPGRCEIAGNGRFGLSRLFWFQRFDVFVTYFQILLQLSRIC